MEVSIGNRIVVLACYCVSGPVQACAVVAPPAEPSFVGKRVHWGPRVYEPDKLYVREEEFNVLELLKGNFRERQIEKMRKMFRAASFAHRDLIILIEGVELRELLFSSTI